MVCHISNVLFCLRPLVDRGTVQASLDSIFCLGITTDGDYETSCFANYLLSNSRRWTGPGSVVGKANGCGLDGPGIESRWGMERDFPHLSRPTLGPT